MILSPLQVIPSPLGNPINGKSMAANITSAPTICQLLSLVSFSFSWSGSSPLGTVSIQGSNDYAENGDGSVKTAGTWNTLTLNYGGSAVTTIAVSGNSGHLIVDMGLTGIYALRAVYTADSMAPGTGNLICIVVGKG